MSDFHGEPTRLLENQFVQFDTSADPKPYPDGGCNVESYCNDKFIELETLGPLTKLEPGGPVLQMETW